MKSGAKIVGLPGGRLANHPAVRQVPFATALALTRSAQQAKTEATAHLRRVLASPKPFTLNSVRNTVATKQRLQANVKVRDDEAKGTPPAKYLRALEFGGVRRFKRFERALQAAGVLDVSEFALPADGGSIDLRGSGNVGGLYTRILSGLRANSDPLSNTPSMERGRRGTKRAKTRAKFFRKGQFIFETHGGKRVRPVLFIIRRAPQYRRTLRFAETVEKASRKAMVREWPRALREAIGTAR